MLGEHGVDFEAREYLKERFTRDELATLLERAGLTPAELVSRRSTPYRQMQPRDTELTDAEWIERMIAEPRLMRRPILVTDDEVVVGFDRERYEAIARRLAG